MNCIDILQFILVKFCRFVAVNTTTKISRR